MSATLDATEIMGAYQKAFRHLQKLPGFSLPQLLTAEAGVILKTWAGRVKVAKSDEVAERSRYVALRRLGATQGGNIGDVTINVGQRGPAGLVWLHTGGRRSGNAWGRTTKARPFSLAGRMDKSGRFVSTWKHFRDSDWREIMDTVVTAEIQINKEVAAGDRRTRRREWPADRGDPRDGIGGQVDTGAFVEPFAINSNPITPWPILLKTTPP